MQGKGDPNRELLDAAALCRVLVPEGSVEAFLADHRHELFPDEFFADLFRSGRGRPSIPADVVATVMVLQSLEGLSDREAARALRDRISWKVAAVERNPDQLDAIGLLALVAGQDVEPGDTDGSWRIVRGVASDRVISTVDPEARHMHKSRHEYRDGYKAHLAVEPETGIITAA